MPLLKSEKAKLELFSKQRSLSVRERSALFLADGLRTRDELVWLLQGDVGMVQKLIADGYLIPAESLSKKAAAKLTDFAASKPAPLPMGDPRSWALSAPSPLSGAGPSSFAGLNPVATAAPASSSDTFEGKRSLATTRMFLFDIVERMFVRKMPELANSLRDQLRAAKDRESMLVIAREIITNVEEIAGPDRADGLSERLAMMLPSED
jgi:hypothetical protein